MTRILGVLVLIGVTSMIRYSQEVGSDYVSPSEAVPRGKAPKMQVQLLNPGEATKRYAVIFYQGDEAFSGLLAVDGHPASSKLDLFEGFTKQIINAVQANPEVWASTAIFVTFDEGGGYYDSGYIQPLDFFGDGTRIPLRAQVTPAVASIISHPRLDPKLVMRVYKKLGISSVEELSQRIESGEVEKLFGARMAQHIRQGLTETQAMLLYRADDLSEAIEAFLLGPCAVNRAEAAGDYRRRVDVVEELVFIIETDDFPAVVARMQRYGGRTPLVSSGEDHALFSLSSGVLLRLQLAGKDDWGFHMVACTGSKAHLKKLTAATGPLRDVKSKNFKSEAALYRKYGLRYIEPELREGHDEVERAKADTLPVLVTAQEIRGDLHAHSMSSDGVDSIEDMAEAGGLTHLTCF